MQLGCIAAGSIAEGSIAAGPIAAGCIAAGPIAAGPIAAGSIASWRSWERDLWSSTARVDGDPLPDMQPSCIKERG